MTNGRSRRRIVQTVLVVAWMCVHAIPVIAQYTSTSTFVTRGGRGTDVLVVNAYLDTSPSMTFGTTKVTIATASGPATADRDLTVVFYIKSLQRERDHIAYHAQARLDEGQSQVVVEIPHMQFLGQSAWDVVVYEDGRDIEDNRKKRSGDWEYQWSYQVDSVRALGFVMAEDETPGEMEADATLLNSNGKEATQVVSGMPFTVAGTSTSNGVGGYRVVALREASADWRQYLPYDAWVLSANAFEATVRSRPEAAAALRHYVGSGGKLLIHSAASTRQVDVARQFFWPEAGREQQHVWAKIKYPSPPWWYGDSSSDTQPLVKRPASAKANGTEGEPAISLPGILYDAFLAFETSNRWSWGNHIDNLRELADFLDSDTLYPYWVDDTRQYLSEELQTEAILRREYLNGGVLIAQKPLVDIPQELLDHARNSELVTSISARVSPGMDGNWFWRNLISAVGKPPVWVFCGIVTLFGTVLGPGLLFLTGRIKRRSLMILLVPLVSLFATVCIIVYGVIHEGFDTYVRITSVQFVEPHSNRGFVWSRQNYFSGLPPREGITFAKDTYARSVSAEDRNYNVASDPRNGAEFHVFLSDEQRWQGWLRARQQQQLIIGHPVNNSSMPIAIEAVGHEVVSVKNLTQDSLPLVVLRGAGDDYYYIETLAANQAVVVEGDEKATTEANVARIVVPYRPELPLELTGTGAMLNLGSRRGLYRATRNNETEDVVNSVFERYLSDHLRIPPHGFAVVKTQSDQVAVPVEGKIDESVHVVVGVQPW